jgi:Protein of unknown function (DUF1488)
MNSPIGEFFVAGRAMPLSHLNEAYRIDPDGFAFGMLHGEQPIYCLVTWTAIIDAMGGDPNSADMAEWLQSNRDVVERTASNLFDKGDPDATAVRVEAISSGFARTRARNDLLALRLRKHADKNRRQ